MQPGTVEKQHIQRGEQHKTDPHLIHRGIQNRPGFFRTAADKQPQNPPAREKHEGHDEQQPCQHDPAGGGHTACDTVKAPRPVILRNEGRGGPVKPAADDKEQTVELLRRRDSRNSNRPVAVNHILNHRPAGGGNAIPRPNRRSQTQQLPYHLPVRGKVPWAQPYFPPTEQPPKAEKGGQRLGDHRGQSSRGHAQTCPADQGDVQDDVQYRGSDKGAERRFTVPQGAEHRGEHVAGKGKQNSRKHDPQIAEGVFKDVLRGVHQGQDGP